ncbi:hypothetical protein D3C85_1236680 [compost metagenome]
MLRQALPVACEAQADDVQGVFYLVAVVAVERAVGQLDQAAESQQQLGAQHRIHWLQQQLAALRVTAEDVLALHAGDLHAVEHQGVVAIVQSL